MRKLLFLLILLSAAFLGCQQDDTVVTPQATDLSLEQRSDALTPLREYSCDDPIRARDRDRDNAPDIQIERPLKVRGTGTLSFGPPSCPDGVVDVFVNGTGNATHLGLFTIALSYCSDGTNPLTPPQGVQTAANGDQLFTMLIGAGMDSGGFFQEYAYDGGTGRFEDAVGYVKLYTQIDMDNLTYSNHGEGWLTY